MRQTCKHANASAYMHDIATYLLQMILKILCCFKRLLDPLKTFPAHHITYSSRRIRIIRQVYNKTQLQIQIHSRCTE